MQNTTRAKTVTSMFSLKTAELEISITRRLILHSSKLKEFADDNFKFDENGRKLSTQVENIGKRRNCSLQAISPFPTVFSKGLLPRGVKRCHCLGMGYTEVNMCNHNSTESSQ